MYLSRAKLKAGRGEALAPLAAALFDGSKGQTIAQAHRIVWMLFNNGEDRAIADAEGKNRLFLWREKAPGEYYILSRKAPCNSHGLFDLDTQEFAPSLGRGDVLRFSLRANPVVTRKNASGAEPKFDGKGRPRGKRCDIVMDALHPFAGEKGPRDDEGGTQRAREREKRTAEAARGWLEGQGRNAGFALVKKPDTEDDVFLSASNYETMFIPRLKGTVRTDSAKFGILDFDGLIEVTDPALFIGKLADGFGKAKAFGCGLMLIRRA